MRRREKMPASEQCLTRRGYYGRHLVNVQRRSLSLRFHPTEKEEAGVTEEEQARHISGQPLYEGAGRVHAGGRGAGLLLPLLV